MSEATHRIVIHVDLKVIPWRENYFDHTVDNYLRDAVTKAVRTIDRAGPFDNSADILDTDRPKFYVEKI